MRIAVISAPARRGGIPDYVTALARGMESMGHRVDVVNAWTDDGMRLPGYEYLAVAAESTTLFSGNMSEALAKILSGAGSLVGRKAAAFLRKTSPFTGKALARLMKALEKEGMVVNWSDIILSAAHAEALGKRIGA
ncbi:MAG: hypothetical protein LBG42_04070 [Treponema sp.]|jgi:hypothetical protein|nr:hypothetical protein [Treponema sp.]